MDRMDRTNVTPIDSRFQVRSEMVDEACVVVVSGEVDLAVVEGLSRACEDSMRRSDTVLVDLCDCTFIDSVGLSALLEASRAAKRDGKRLAIASTPHTPPRALFDLVFGRGLFESCDDRASGLAALRLGS